jgi:transcription antitermination factor NusG
MAMFFTVFHRSTWPSSRSARRRGPDFDAFSMTTSDDMRWFAIQTRPNAEGTAASQLRSLSVETLLPFVRRPLRHATRAPRMVLRPLFPSYLFARFCATVSLRAVSYSRGVLRVLGGASDRPWPVEDTIIATIRERLGPEGCVELVERPFGAGDSVRITAGPLAGWSGIFDSELSDAQRVVILVETLQQGRVVIRRDCLELSEAA